MVPRHLHRFCWITLIILSMTYLCNSTVTPKTYGSACSSEILTYSESQDACLIKVGRRCSDEEDEGETFANTIHQNVTKCILNAECRKLKLRKWCRCKEGFMSNREGTLCAPVARYGEACNDDSLCEKRTGTVCLNGKCQCPFGDHQYFDESQRKCISLANGNCSIANVSPCVNNAVCTNIQLRTGFTTETGVEEFYTMSVTQCHCTKGYSGDKDGRCKALAGTHCEAFECHSGLACVDGRCKCRNPLSEMEDMKTGKCYRLVGSSVQANETIGCIANSENVSGVCTCKPGYSETPKRTCLKSYNEVCRPSECNAGLVCLDGICECFDSSLTYQESSKACVGLSSSSD